MKKFAGFPRRMQFTPVPDLFINRVLPQISDIAELKATLLVFSIIYHKRGYPRFATLTELQSCRAGESLTVGIEAAVRRGTILSLAVSRDGSEENIIFINDPAGREAIERLSRGELALPGLEAKPPEKGEEPPDIFTRYEDNIGMLTPIIADELRQAEKIYPAGWINDAIKEAAANNKRSWRYISAILERWSQEGRSDGAHRGDSETDPDRYVKGRYGHLVQR